MPTGEENGYLDYGDGDDDCHVTGRHPVDDGGDVGNDTIITITTQVQGLRFRADSKVHTASPPICIHLPEKGLPAMLHL